MGTRHERHRRVQLDLCECTVRELISCVADRVLRCEQRGADVPHITRIAMAMLREAIDRR